MAIVSKAEMYAYLGADENKENKRLDMVIESVNKWVENYVGGIYGEVREVEEERDLEDVIFLYKNDVKEVLEVKVRGEDVKELVSIKKSSGRLIFRYRLSGDVVNIKYLAGCEEVPSDLKNATMRLGADMYNRSDNAEKGGVVSESLGDYSVSYGNADKVNGVGVGGLSDLSDYMAVFNYYKSYRV